MTIDERIEKLTERHEALAQSVELLAADLRQQKENFDQLGQKVDKLADITADLVKVARIHEHRISDLEGGS